jgi:WD40 repeat protein
VSGAEALSPLQCHEDSVSSVAFSSDGTRIVSGSFDDTVYVWDTATGCPYVQNGVHDEQSDSHYISLTSGAWIVDLYTKRTISKLPAMIAPWDWATSEKSIVIGTKGGQVIILHFPQAMFTSPETRPTKAGGAI